MKLFAVDLDGTCLNEKHRFSEQTLEALRKASDAGIMIVPTTGRSLSCLPRQLLQEEFFPYVITSNGARVSEWKTGKTLFQQSIPKNRALELVHLASELRVGITAHINQNYFVQGKKLFWLGKMVYGDDAAGGMQVSNMEQVIREQSGDVEELQLYFFSSGKGERLREALSREAQGCLCAYGNVYVEIFSRLASKGNALTALAGRLGIEKSEIGCIGDSENDIPMFRAAGCCLAMGNAVDSLKQRADAVVASNREHGVAQAIEKYVLPRV